MSAVLRMTASIGSTIRYEEYVRGVNPALGCDGTRSSAPRERTLVRWCGTS